MATIQIRDIPEDAYETLRERARSAGKSLQSYMRDEVVRFASHQTKEEAIAALETALERNQGTGVTLDKILDAKDADRR